MKTRTILAGVAGGLACIAFVLGAMGYWMFGQVFGPMFPFPYLDDIDAHPLQYIALVSLAYGVAGAFWFRFCVHRSAWFRLATALGAVLLATLISCLFGGMLWHIHYGFPGTGLGQSLVWAMTQGARVGPAILASDHLLAYSGTGLVLGTAVLLGLPRILRWVTHRRGS